MRRFLLGSAVLFVLPISASGVTTLSGYYEARTEYYGSQDGASGYLPWHLNTPVHYLELRVLTTPWSNIEGFVEFATSSDRWIQSGTERDPRVFISEGHLRFRTSHAEVYLFNQQNRFWFSEPFLEIVNSDRVKDDFWGPRAQGVRFDFWDYHGFGGLAYYAKQLKSSSDDYRVARIYKHFAGNNIVLGSTYARKDFGLSSRDYDEVVAGDLEIALGEVFESLSGFGRMTLAFEGGKNISGWLWGNDDAMPLGAFAEIRDVRKGALSLRAQWQYWEPDFYTGMSSREGDDDYKGYYVEVQYRLPKKAINLKFSRNRYDAFRQRTAAGELYFRQQYLGEIYVEFLYGIVGKVEYKWYQDHNGTYPNWFFELTGRNKLMSVRPQFRIKDVGTVYELEAYGIEFNINVRQKAKLYSRIMNVNSDTESRQTIFAQLRYDAWSGGELFIEYGNPDHNNDLVNDDDFVNWQSTLGIQNYVKCFMKVYF